MKPRILVVVGEAGLRENLAALLAAEDCEVAPCAGGAEVGAALDAGAVDLAFVDGDLANEPGIPVLAGLRERFPFCPVVVITGAPASDTAAESPPQWAFDSIARPVRRDALRRACRLGLEHKALLEEREACRASLEATRSRLAALEALLKSRQGDAPPGGRRLEDLPPRERILKAIERAGGNRSEAAKLLGWSRRTLYRKLAEHGIAGGEPDTGA